jgi:hypothetical protein
MLNTRQEMLAMPLSCDQDIFIGSPIALLAVDGVRDMSLEFVFEDIEAVASVTRDGVVGRNWMIAPD